MRTRLNPGLHMVLTFAEHACDHVLKRVLKLSTYRLQLFLVKYEHLPSLQLCEDQGILGKLKKRVRKHMLAILTTYSVFTALQVSVASVPCDRLLIVRLRNDNATDDGNVNFRSLKKFYV